MSQPDRRPVTARRRSGLRFEILNAFVDGGMAGLSRAELAVWLALYRDTKPDVTARASLADLASIPGGLPDLRRSDLPACRYSGRCDRRLDDCARPLPRRALGDRHMVACWNPL